MQNSRLIKIIRVFSKEEIDALAKLIKINFFSTPSYKSFSKLFELIYQYYPKLDHKNLSKEVIYKKIYGDTEWIPGKLDKLITQSLSTVYQFISLYFGKNYIHPQITICNFLKTRDLNPIFNRELKKLKKINTKNKYHTSDLLYDNFLLKELMVKDQSTVINPKIDFELPNMLNSLDQFYFLTKLEYACQLLMIDLFVFPVKIEDSLKSLHALEELILLPHLRIPSILVYYQAYKLLTSEVIFQSENFKKFEALLYEHESELSPAQQKALHTFIRNYALFQYHNGQKDYLQIVFNIYKIHLGKGFFYHKEKILAQSFLNIVTSGLRLQAYDWVYQFILDHRDKIIGPEPSEIIFNFNLALYYFHTKKYDKALKILPYNFDDYYYKIRGIRLELLIYFDTDSPILDAKINAYKIFIYRIPVSKINQEHKAANNNFIHLLMQIQHPKTAFDLERIDKLITKVQNLEHLVEREWLVQTLDEMKQKLQPKAKNSTF